MQQLKFTALVFVAFLLTGMTADLCVRLQARCILRVGCSIALHNYFLNCRELINQEMENCSPACNEAIVGLMSAEDLMSCDCNGDTICINHQRRTNVCKGDVMRSLKEVNDNHSDVNCSLAEVICHADTSCHAALEFVTDNCIKLFKGIRCDSRCKNSILILLRQKAARKLENCICHGSEDYPCKVLQRNTRRLCFQQETKIVPWEQKRSNASQLKFLLTLCPIFFIYAM